MVAQSMAQNPKSGQIVRKTAMTRTGVYTGRNGNCGENRVVSPYLWGEKPPCLCAKNRYSSSLPQVRRACHELVRAARRAITELTGLPPITPDTPEWFAQMAALPLPPCDGQDLQRRLYERFRIEVPVTAWNERHFVRISIQGYNTRADVDALVEELRELVACGAPP